MGTTFQSLSHHLKQAGNGLFHSLSHVHQVLSAALGYKSFAAYKASSEEAPTYDGATHVLLDVDLVAQRLADLGYPTREPVVSAVIDAIRTAIHAQLPDTAVHLDQSDVTDGIHGDVEAAIEDSGEYSGQIAMTNAFGGYFDLDMSAATPLQAPDTEWVVNAQGTSSLEHDPDKVYHGDVIDVTARVVFQKLGRRVLGEMDVTEIGAAIQHDGSEYESEPEPDWLP